MANNQQQLGKYELQERLGRGGMAEVWKAFDPQLRRHVAIKFLQANLRTDPDFMIRFVREAQVIASLHHPNIVQVYDFHTPGEGDDSSMPYMVMDYIEGGQTLADYIRNTSRKGLFPSSEELLHLFTAITLAVDYAHQHNMIHRDIKPANILLDKRNVTHNPMGEPILSDFGIVKMLGTATGTLTSSSIGTPLYVSPEQAQGHPGNERSDIYSLGVVLYEMCTGVPPFRGDGPYAIMMQHVHENPTPPRLINQEIPAALEVVILRCLAKDPTARFPRATSLAAALAEALNLPVPEAVKRIATYPLDPTEQPTYFSPLPDQVEAAAARQSASASPNRAVHQTPGPVSVAKKASERTEYHAPAAVANTPSSLPTVAQAEQAAPASRPSRASETPPPAGPLPTSSPFQAGGNRPRPLFIALAAFIIIVALIGTTLFFLLPRPGSTAAQNGPAAGQNQSVGSAFFVDSGQSNPNSTITSDSFSIRLTNIPDPAPGNAYYAWLPPDDAHPESGTVALGPLTVNHGLATLAKPFVDPAHLNLLNQAGSFLITEQQAGTPPLGPSTDKHTWRYIATLPQKKGADNFSGLDHLRHLLSNEPTLQTLGLNGGLDYWLRENSEEIWKWSREAIDHSMVADRRAKVVNILYYLHGLCTTQDLSQAAPNTNTQPDSAAIAGTRMPLLDCAQTPGDQHLGYIKHIISHLNGVLHAPGSTPAQAALANQIITALSNVNLKLEQIQQDAQQLIQMDDAHFQASPLLGEIEHLASQANGGWFDQGTGKTYAGTEAIYGMIQSLAAFDVQPFKAQ